MASQTNLPNLQSPRTEDASPLVLGQVPGGDADLVRLTFALLLYGYSWRLTVCHFLIAASVTIGCLRLVRVSLAI